MGSLEEIQLFPPLTKKEIIGRSDEIFQHGAITQAYSTGGSSGEPTRFPAALHEALDNYARTYAARSWWGLQPMDPYLHIWGHSHLFGGGPVQKLKRRVQDTLSGAMRVNAYDMSEEGIAGHYQALIRQNPMSIIGYTSAVFRLARHIEHHKLRTRGLTRLKAVIVTSETVTEPDIEVLERVFGVPVVIEYGSAETGTIATSRGNSFPLQVLHLSNLVQLASEGGIRVTTLTDRIFPLINYDIGDRGEAAERSGGSVLKLAHVQGRAREVVKVRKVNGQMLELSPILPVHILKSEPGIVAVQYRQHADRLEILLTGHGELPLSELAQLFGQRLGTDHPDFDPASVTFEQVPAPVLTKAGKHALFVS
ncbi:hypothetical protein DVJ83_16250 (plasmid) [Deinococcus wulumuqiensis]|uniref:Phenylacetate--CoA ligase family protein n=1 Tax=Deinococcus wulumuqiensis TaxID=980427 RepID=A0A345ILY2_9DEIO|nr:hypothetical protein DVJ83_16250 [Deinococcus wulumuqiensis]